MSTTKDESKAGGAAFDDYFESLGKKAESLSISKPEGDKAGVNADDSKDAANDDDDDARVVDEIESLCMNCQANVSRTLAS